MYLLKVPTLYYNQINSNYEFPSKQQSFFQSKLFHLPSYKYFVYVCKQILFSFGCCLVIKHVYVYLCQFMNVQNVNIFTMYIESQTHKHTKPDTHSYEHTLFRQTTKYCNYTTIILIMTCTERELLLVYSLSTAFIHLYSYICNF